MQGMGKICMYCGDGINDLIALAAADVGVAIGASDASAAATISTTDCSIAGICHLQTAPSLHGKLLLMTSSRLAYSDSSCYTLSLSKLL